MIIPASYISSFLPVQDLDELQSSTGLAPLHPDDLFLVSQLSAYATGEQNAVALSKKLRYGAFRNTLSSEFNVNDIKLSIDGLSNDVHDLSAYTLENTRNLSNAIVLSTYTLSTYSNELCTSLSDCVSSNFVHKYEQTCALVHYNPNTPQCPADFAENVYLSDGHLTVTSWRSLSDLIVPKDWRIAAGAIAGDNYSTTLRTFNGTETSIIYTLSNDCYLNCCISALEDDSYSSLQMWIKSSLTPSSGVLYKTFNNPGGFSGKPFYNNYHIAVPLTKLAGSGNGVTTIVLKYEKPGLYFQNSGQAVFTEYYFYAVPSKDDLSGYVKKSSEGGSTPSLPQYNDATVCKINFNDDGLLTNVTSVYYGLATDTLCGLVKTASNDASYGPKYFLSLSSNAAAYVNVPRATANTFGTVKFATAPSTMSYHEHAYGNVLYNTDLSHFLSCCLENVNDVATTFIPCATDSTFGVVKLSSNFYQFDIRERPVDPLSSFLNVDASGHAYVTTPMAHVTNDGTSVPGLIKTGTPDTSEIRVVRSVYLDTDGVAKVNVANQIGVGLFHVNEPNSGYTKRIELPLNDFTTDSCAVSTFLGNVAQLSDYGSYIATKYEDVNSWFMAQLVLDGISKDYGENDPALQVVCDGIVVTTIHPKHVQNAIGKHFTYSTYLGVFRGELFQDTDVRQRRLFAVASNYTDFGDNKLHFLIKEANFNT